MERKWVKRQLARLWQHLPWVRDTGVLFVVDMLANGVDYAFHILLGRWLLPGDFAVVQTLNSTVLVLATVAGVFQPVVARFVAEADLRSEPDQRVTIFQTFARAALILGVIGAVIAVAGSGPVASALGVPASTVAALAVMCLTVLARPILSGVLQGAGRFAALGLTRVAYAVGRFGVSLLLLSLGAGVSGAVAALPLGSLISVVAGLIAVGRDVWRPAPKLASGLLRQAWRLSAAALVGFGAYMSMMNLDLIWVNRSFAPQIAGSYATAVLLRRIVSLLPGAMVVVMYPRVVAAIASGQRPDRLLAFTAAVIVGSGAALALFYGVFGSQIVRLAFGAAYEGSAALLAAMAVAMIGFGLGSLWLNVFLAARPWKYVLWLVVVALTEVTLLARFHGSLNQVVTVLALSAWSVTVGGTLLYVLDLRPGLEEAEVV